MGLTSSLLKDHEIILDAVKNLELRVGGWRMAGRINNPESLQKFIEFTKLFTDRCHHGKEEKCLFPCLVRLGIPEEGGPIGVMLTEHKIMRGIISRLEKSFNDYLLTGSGLENALSLCMDYIFQLRQHVDKENGVLFPTGENIAGEDDKKGRTNAMSMLKKSRSGMCSVINYHVLLKKSSLSCCPTHKVPVSSPLQKLRRLAHHSC